MWGAPRNFRTLIIFMIDDITTHAYLNADTASTLGIEGVVTAKARINVLQCY